MSREERESERLVSWGRWLRERCETDSGRWRRPPVATRPRCPTGVLSSPSSWRSAPAGAVSLQSLPDVRRGVHGPLRRRRCPLGWTCPPAGHQWRCVLRRTWCTERHSNWAGARPSTAAECSRASRRRDGCRPDGAAGTRYLRLHTVSQSWQLELNSI